MELKLGSKAKLKSSSLSLRLNSNFISGLSAGMLTGSFGGLAWEEWQKFKVQSVKYEKKKADEKAILINLAWVKRREDNELNYPGFSDHFTCKLEFWNRAEICHLNLFDRMHKYKFQTGRRFYSIFELKMKTISAVTASISFDIIGRGATFSPTLTSLHIRNWKLDDGTFQLGSIVHYNHEGVQLFRLAADERNYPKLKSCKLVSCNQFSLRFREDDLQPQIFPRYFETSFTCGGLTQHANPLTNDQDARFNEQHYGKSHIAIEDLLDPEIISDERFNNIFDTDLALSFTQAKSIAEHSLRQSSTIFPDVLLKLLFEYAK